MSDIRRARYMVGLWLLRPVLINDLLWVKDRYKNAPPNPTLTYREQERFWMGQISAVTRIMQGRATAKSRKES